MNDDRLKELNAEFSEAMKESVAKVLDGKSKEEKIYFVRPDEAHTYLGTLGVENDPSADMFIDTNGWEWDFWMTLVKGDKKYCLYGDGFYLDYIGFRVDED